KAAQARLDESEAERKRLGYGPGSDAPKSIGQMFVESEAYKNFNPHSQRQSDAVQVKSFYRHERKTLTGDPLGTVPGYIYSPERLAEIIAPPERSEERRVGKWVRCRCV